MQAHTLGGLTSAIFTSSIQSQAVSQGPSSEGPSSATVFGNIRDAFESAQVWVKTMSGFAEAQATLRQKRASPPPTGYNPAQAMSTAGQKTLEQSAAAYEQAALSRHLVNGILIPQAIVDTKTQAVKGGRADTQDSGYHSGQLLAAMACKYAITRDPHDLATLRTLATGVMNLMTLSDRGPLINPNTGETVAAGSDTPVRCYVDADAADFQNSPEFFSGPGVCNADVYVYNGSLPGATGQRFLVKTIISIDQIDGMLFGLSKAAEVLDKTAADPELRDTIAGTGERFGKRLMQNKGKLLDLDGQPSPLADISDEANPVSVLTMLSWLKSTAMMSRDPALDGAYQSYYARTAGSLAGDLFAFAAASAQPLVEGVREVIEDVVADFNYNLLMLPSEPLLALETEASKRAFYRSIFDNLIATLVTDFSVPFFDELNMMANGTSLSLAAHVNGVLGQFRPKPLPPVHPAVLANESDPLFTLLSNGFSAAFPGVSNPVHFGGQVWDFGPGLAPQANSIERPNRFRPALDQFVGNDPATGDALVLELGGEDFLLNYWYGRYEGVIAGSQLSAGPAPGAPPAQEPRFELSLFAHGCG